MTLRERVLYAIQSEGYGQDPSDMYDRIYAAVEACFEPPAARSVPQANGYSGTLPENVTWIGEIDGKRYHGLKPKSDNFKTDHLPEGSH